MSGRTTLVPSNSSHSSSVPDKGSASTLTLVCQVPSSQSNSPCPPDGAVVE